MATMPAEQIKDQDLVSHLKLVVSNTRTSDARFQIIAKLLSDTFSGAGVIILHYTADQELPLAGDAVLAEYRSFISELVTNLRQKRGAGYLKLDFIKAGNARIIGLNLLSPISDLPIGCFMVVLHQRYELSREDQKRMVVAKEFIQEQLIEDWQSSESS